MAVARVRATPALTSLSLNHLGTARYGVPDMVNNGANPSMDLWISSGICSGASDLRVGLEAQASVPPNPTVLDTMLKILNGVRPECKESDVVQTTVEKLDECMNSVASDSVLYVRALRHLQALCRYTKYLPASCYLREPVTLLNQGPIHQSAFSDVYRGRLGAVDVAVKAIRIRLDNRVKVEKAYYDEVIIWRRLRHPNIVPFLGASNLIDFSLVSEWMVNGTITMHLQRNPEDDRSKYIRDVVQGLMFVHSVNLVHGDLKAANVLVDAAGNACLADFGMSAPIYSSVNSTGTTSFQGTLRWMSPELLSMDDSDSTELATYGLTPASDCYALGMLIWEICTGRVPFDHIKRDLAVITCVLRGRRPKRPTALVGSAMSDALWAVMERCWSADPKQRPPLSAILTTLDTPEGQTMLSPPTADMESDSVYPETYNPPRTEAEQPPPGQPARWIGLSRSISIRYLHYLLSNTHPFAAPRPPSEFKDSKIAKKEAARRRRLAEKRRRALIAVCDEVGTYVNF